MGPMALLPPGRKACYGFSSPLKIHYPWLSLNLQTLGPMASTLTTRPPRITRHYDTNKCFCTSSWMTRSLWNKYNNELGSSRDEVIETIIA
jgi:hypothetical protein